LKWILPVVAILLAPAFAWAGDDYERWYVVEMGKSRAGWMEQSQKTEGDQIKSASKLEFSMSREATGAKITMESSFIETKAGKPVSMTSTLKFGVQPTVMKATFGEKEIEVTITQSGRSETSKHPLPEGTWLPPAAAGDYVKQRMAAGADKVVVRTVEPIGGMDPMSALKPVTIERSGFSPVEYEFEGKKVKATRCLTTSSSQPGVKSTEIVDEQGVPLSSEASMGLITMGMRAVSKEEATAPIRKGPEMMVSTFVKPDKPIENARMTHAATFVVSVPDGKLPEIPATGSQKVERIDAISDRVRIDSRSLTPDDPGDAGAGMYTACSTMINCNDPEVQKLSKQAVAHAGSDKLAHAKAIREFVYKFIDKKDLDVGFATATEVARTHQGDCTEHGVLVAALLRADGIPSRVASGLIYADQFAGGKNIFAYHMWAQGLLEINGKPTWVDLDGTLPNGKTFDATHIALAVSALADGDTQESFMTMATMLGRLQIKVEKTE
jgi:hypothetical protein